MGHWGHAHRGTGMTGIRCEGGIDLEGRNHISRLQDVCQRRNCSCNCDFTFQQLRSIDELPLTANRRMVLMASSSSLP